jgi:hypothetical protein
MKESSIVTYPVLSKSTKRVCAEYRFFFLTLMQESANCKFWQWRPSGDFMSIPEQEAICCIAFLFKLDAILLQATVNPSQR